MSEILNNEEVDSWLWEHAQIQGHQCDSIKDEDGLNIAWKDTVTEEVLEVIRD